MFDHLDSDIKALGNKVDNKFERMDTKFGRMMYFFLGAVVIKGGFDFLLQDRKDMRHTDQKLIEQKPIDQLSIEQIRILQNCIEQKPTEPKAT